MTLIPGHTLPEEFLQANENKYEVFVGNEQYLKELKHQVLPSNYD